MPKPFLRALKGESLSPPPIWLMRQAGRYLAEYRAVRERAGGFLDLCFTPELAAEVTLQPIRRFGLDAAILFSDILVVPHALGQRVEFLEGEGPRLEAITETGALGRLDIDGLHSRLAPVYETVERLAGGLPAKTALIGFAGAPWTVATYMVEGGSSRDFATVRGWGFKDPAGFSKLIDLVTEATVAYLCRQADAGAEALQLFDSWAGVLSEDEFHRWVIAPTARIVTMLRQRHPGVPLIGFPRGAGVMYEEYVRQTGVDVVSIDSTLPLKWAAEHLQPLAPVQGNLDPLALLTGGETLEWAAKAVLGGLAGGPFVFNLGHGIVKETPPDHVARLVEIIRDAPAEGRRR